LSAYFGVLRMIGNYIAGAHATDITTVVIAWLVLGAVAALACLVPARGALRVTLGEVLRIG
jgi:hypothetical protein